MARFVRINAVEFGANAPPGVDAGGTRPVRACLRLMRILLVDGSQECLNGMAALISTDPGFEVVARVRSGWDALEKATELRPDVVLLDLLIPGLDGLQVARELKAWPNAPRVVFFSLCDAPEYRAEAQAAGADGFVSKMESPAVLVGLLQVLHAQTERWRLQPHLSLGRAKP